jgi:hypothetical protein
MVSAGLLSATAKAWAWNERSDGLKKRRSVLAVRPEGPCNNPSIFHAARASEDRAVKADQQSAPRSLCKKPGTRNMSMLSIKVVR